MNVSLQKSVTIRPTIGKRGPTPWQKLAMLPNFVSDAEVARSHRTTRRGRARLRGPLHLAAIIDDDARVVLKVHERTLSVSRSNVEGSVIG